MSKPFLVLITLIIAISINAWAAVTFFKMGFEEGKNSVPVQKVLPPTKEAINRQCVDWFFSANFKQVKKDICKGSIK